MYSMLVSLVFGSPRGFVCSLRILAISALLALSFVGSAAAATIVYTPLRSDTEVWNHTGLTGWQSSIQEGFFLAGIRETTVARALFEIPAFDLDLVVSVTFRVSIPDSFGIQSLTYLRVYGATGDPMTPWPGGTVPGRDLLYFKQNSTAITSFLEFNLTDAMRKARTTPDEQGLFRVDLTAYTPEGRVLPLTNPELIVHTVPEPSTPLLFLCALAILISMRRRVARACRK